MDPRRDIIEVLEQKIIALLNKLKEQQEIISAQITALKEENKSLTIANNLLGSNEGKSITKNKLNRLIKEVDACIDQLSEILE